MAAPKGLQDHLVENLEKLATFNRSPELGGVTREVFTPEYFAAMDLVSGFMEKAGLEVRTDSFGNLFGRWEGESGRTVLTGSHFDTTLNAGKYDGTVGVLGGIEALGLLREEGFTPGSSLEVVAFAGEEPRFGVGCIGSRAAVGDLSREDLDVLRDRDGVSIAEALEEAGLDPDAVDDARLNYSGYRAFVELHVEQGAVLEDEGLPVGVVRKIAAPHDLQIVIRGSAMHSGSTPMYMRRDASVGAAEALVELERLAKESDSGSMVATAGVMKVGPGAINVIPGEVVMEIDVRDSELDVREQVIEDFLGTLGEICGRRNLKYSVEEIVQDVPQECSPEIVRAAEEACEQLEVPYLPMISGAYHDAMVLAQEIPMGMIFVPSAGGISHSPDEFTAPEDITRGVRVLAHTLARLAG